MHFAAIGAGIEDALLPNVKRPTVGPVHFFVGILLLQFQQERREVSALALGGFGVVGRIALGVLLEAFIPVGFHRRHVPARGNVPANAAAGGIHLIAPAADFLGFDAGWVLDLERPKHAVQHVAAHVANRTVAEVIPIVPIVRV